MAFPTNPPIWQDSSLAAVDVQTNNVWTQAAVDAICEDIFYLLGADGKSPTAGIPVRLGDTTLGAPATNVTFSSIPATFKHLWIELQSRGDGALTNEEVQMQFNGDTTSIYDRQRLLGGNATPTAQAAVAQPSIAVGLQTGASAARAAIAATLRITIPNYASTVFEKSAHGVGGFADSTAANNFFSNYVGSWRSTAAINAIKLFPTTSTNFTTGTRATLYGVN